MVRYPAELITTFSVRKTPLLSIIFINITLYFYITNKGPRTLYTLSGSLQKIILDR
jgi:hypothetical protein